MRKRYLLLIWVLVGLIGSCQNGTKESANNLTADIIIEAEAFTSSSTNVTKKATAIAAGRGEEWAGFSIQVNEPGRYRTEVIAKGEGRVWLEDYHDNPDGRTYNITGAMQFSSPDGFASVIKDGSPMNSGSHNIKLHMAGNLEVDKVLLTKIIDHQNTPVLMTQSTKGANWKLVWSDEFEGSGAPDTSKWTYDIGNWGWGNNEPQYYTVDRRENARLEDGNLIIEARKNDMGQEWTSARVTTRGKVSFLYGKIEFRAKAPVNDGSWAAGWLLGDSYRDELSWPYCGEIDVLECVGKEIDDETGDGINHASCHTRTYYFKEGTQITAVTEVKDMDNTFHTYAIEWMPDGINAYLDGEHYYTYDKTNDELEWPFAKPQNLIVNLAMGGGMGGEIDSTIESQQFILDYIRVYELTD